VLSEEVAEGTGAHAQDATNEGAGEEVAVLADAKAVRSGCEDLREGISGADKERLGGLAHAGMFGKE
jgi:hypothetical protein